MNDYSSLVRYLQIFLRDNQLTLDSKESQIFLEEQLSIRKKQDSLNVTTKV